MNLNEEHGGSPLEIQAASTTSQYTRRRFVKKTGKTAIGAVLALAAFSAEQDAFAGGSSSFLYFVAATYPGSPVEGYASVTYPDGHPATIIDDEDAAFSNSSDHVGTLKVAYSVTPVPQTEIWAGLSPEEDSGSWIYGAEGNFSITINFSAQTWMQPAATRLTGPNVTRSITFSCSYDKSGFHTSTSGGGDPGDPAVEDGQFQVTFNRTNPSSPSGFGVEFQVTWSGRDEEGWPYCDPIVSQTLILNGSWAGIAFPNP